MLLLLAMVPSLEASQPLFTYGQWSSNYSVDATRLRADLLNGYDRVVPPMSTRLGNYSSAGTDVSLEVFFIKVQAVSAAAGSMRLKAWVRLMWVDKRLAWDPAKYSGITYVHFWTDTRPTAQSTEIWVPDIAPYNSNLAMGETLDPQVLKANSDGSIYFSRPGSLDLICRFTGLTAFPFDSLKCEVEFGNWMYSGGHMGLRPHKAGFELISSSPQEASLASSYQEFTIANVSVREVNYKYQCCPNEPWPGVVYKITLKRALMFYQFTIIVPTMLITLLSFVVFFLPPNSVAYGYDPLSYGITIIVVVVLMQVVIINMLPVCEEPLWINLFILSNTGFCMLALFESCVSIIIEHLEVESLVPHAPLSRCFGGGCLGGGCLGGFWPSRAAALGKAPWAHGTGGRKEKDDADLSAPQQPDKISLQEVRNLAKSTGALESIAGVFYRSVTQNTEAAQKGGSLSANYKNHRRGAVPDFEFKGEAHGEAHGEASSRSAWWLERTPAVQAILEATACSEALAQSTSLSPGFSLRPTLREGGSQLTDDDRLRLTYFESLFFKLDIDRSGTIDHEECGALLSFTALDMTKEEQEAAFKEAGIQPTDPLVTRMSFVRLCTQELWNVPMTQIDLAVENIRGLRQANLERVRTKWRTVSHTIDRIFSLCTPTLYVISQIVIFNTDFQDDYDDHALYGRRIEQFGLSGAGAVRVLRFHTTGIVAIVLFTLAALLCLMAWLLARQVTVRKEQAVREVELQKSMRTAERESEFLGKQIVRERTRAAQRGTSTNCTPTTSATDLEHDVEEGNFCPYVYERRESSRHSSRL